MWCDLFSFAVRCGHAISFRFPSAQSIHSLHPITRLAKFMSSYWIWSDRSLPLSSSLPLPCISSLLAVFLLCFAAISCFYLDLLRDNSWLCFFFPSKRSVCFPCLIRLSLMSFPLSPSSCLISFFSSSRSPSLLLFVCLFVLSDQVESDLVSAFAKQIQLERDLESFRHVRRRRTKRERNQARECKFP